MLKHRASRRVYWIYFWSRFLPSCRGGLSRGALILLIVAYVRTLQKSNITFTFGPAMNSSFYIAETIKAITRSSAREKPIFVIHIGPHKTGTSFQQALFSELHDHPAWKLDNYLYLGTFSRKFKGKLPEYGLKHGRSAMFDDASGKHAVTGYCFDPEIDDATIEHRFSTSFLENINRVRNSGRNVLMVFEGLAYADPNTLNILKNLLEPNWKVQVLLNYRVFYDWLPSLYQQYQKTDNKRRTWNGGPTAPLDIDMHDIKIGDNNTKRIAVIFGQFEKRQKHPVAVLKELYQSYFGQDNIRLIPLSLLSKATENAPDPMVEYLFCSDVLQVPTPNLCLAVQKGDFDQDVYSNPAISMNFDMLAMAAFERGLIPQNKTRSRARQAISRYQRIKLGKKANDFPLVCMEQEKLDRLEALSWRMEFELFPNASQSAHHEGFRAKRKSFCSIDTEQTLKDPQWSSFFQGMRS